MEKEKLSVWKKIKNLIKKVMPSKKTIAIASVSAAMTAAVMDKTNDTVVQEEPDTSTPYTDSARDIQQNPLDMDNLTIDANALKNPFAFKETDFEKSYKSSSEKSEINEVKVSSSENTVSQVLAKPKVKEEPKIEDKEINEVENVVTQEKTIDTKDNTKDNTVETKYTQSDIDKIIASLNPDPTLSDLDKISALSGGLKDLKGAINSLSMNGDISSAERLTKTYISTKQKYDELTQKTKQTQAPTSNLFEENKDELMAIIDEALEKEGKSTTSDTSKVKLNTEDVDISVTPTIDASKLSDVSSGQMGVWNDFDDYLDNELNKNESTQPANYDNFVNVDNELKNIDEKAENVNAPTEKVEIANNEVKEVTEKVEVTNNDAKAIPETDKIDSALSELHEIDWDAIEKDDTTAKEVKSNDNSTEIKSSDKKVENSKQEVLDKDLNNFLDNLATKYSKADDKKVENKKEVKSDKSSKSKVKSTTTDYKNVDFTKLTSGELNQMGIWDEFEKMLDDSLDDDLER